MVVYMDVVFFENLIINFFILLITLKLNKQRYKYVFILLASSFGAIYSVVAFIPNFQILKSFFVKVIFALIMLFIASREKDVKEFFKCTLTFFLIAFMLSGMCFMFALAQNDYTIGRNFVIENYNVKYSIIAIMLLYIVINRIFDYLKDKAKISNFFYDLEFNIYEKSLKIRGFLDTGNELIEPVTLLPVIIIHEDSIKDSDLKNEEVFYIPFNVVGGYGGRLKGVRINDIKIKNKEGVTLKKDAVVCICPNKLSGDYEALLSRSVI